MATTSRYRVGRIRERLAELLSEQGFSVDPGDLRSQIPVYASPKWDCCSWDGWGADKDGLKVHFASWDTMRELVKHGLYLVRDGTTYEVFCRPKAEIAEVPEIPESNL